MLGSDQQKWDEARGMCSPFHEHRRVPSEFILPLAWGHTAKLIKGFLDKPSWHIISLKYIK